MEENNRHLQSLAAIKAQLTLKGDSTTYRVSGRLSQRERELERVLFLFLWLSFFYFSCFVWTAPLGQSNEDIKDTWGRAWTGVRDGDIAGLDWT